MNNCSLRQVLESRNKPCISSGVQKLDGLLKGGEGFKTGIYDVSGSVGNIGIGVYEIVFNAMIGVLQQNKKILYIQTTNKIPWFKLTKSNKYQKSFGKLINCIEIENLIELIVVFQAADIFKPYAMVIIDSFPTLYSNYFRLIRSEINNSINDSKVKNSGNNETIIKFYQSIRKLFHVMQSICFQNDQLMIFTIGSMEVFNQKVKIYTSDESDDNDSEIHTSATSFINQQILVPVISLKSDINSYYTNRIIIYRDWVAENSENQLIQGLTMKTNFLEESISLLNNRRMKCLPHYLCITSNPVTIDDTESSVSNTGFFLVDNNFQIIDIEHLNNKSFDFEIPDSQG